MGAKTIHRQEKGDLPKKISHKELVERNELDKGLDGKKVNPSPVLNP